MLLVADPAIGAILAAEAVLERVLAVDEKIPDLGLDPGQIFGMDVLAPEIRVIEVVARGVAEQRRNVIADEDRREIVPSLEAVDYRWRGVEQPRQPLLRRDLEIDDPPLGSLLGLARRLVQDLFNDVGDGRGVDRAFGAPSISASAAAAALAHSLKVVMSPTISPQSPVLGPFSKEEGPWKRKSLLGIRRSSSYCL